MTTLCFIDTETTGLDARIHQPYEVCIWREDAAEPKTLELPHSLVHADQQALNIGGYWERDQRPWGEDVGRMIIVRGLVDDLRGVTLVGSNPAFDAAMLTRFIGAPVWHHRLINVAEGGMWVFGWDRPKGLADVANECRTRGYGIPEPDHTAEGDVRTTRAVYEALRAITTPNHPAPTHAGETEQPRLRERQEDES
jgi:DNA polymerase-3 subunit epsilon